MKQIKGFSRYFVDEYGNVFNSTKQIKHYVGNNGYHYIKLVDDEGKTKHQSIHRLVALTHKETSDTSLTVNHIDGNRENNHISNLEWLTQRENLLKGYERRGDTPMKFHTPCFLYVDGIKEKSFTNIKEAAYYAQENHNVSAQMLRKWKSNKNCQIRCNDYPEGE